jgi:hypothetical protein
MTNSFSTPGNSIQSKSPPNPQRGALLLFKLRVLQNTAPVAYGIRRNFGENGNRGVGAK